MRRLASLLALVSVTIGLPTPPTGSTCQSDCAKAKEIAYFGNGAYGVYARVPKFVELERGYDPEPDCKGTYCTDVVTGIEYGDGIERRDSDLSGEATRGLDGGKGEDATQIEYASIDHPDEALQPHDGRAVKYEMDVRDGGEDHIAADRRRSPFDLTRREYDRQRHGEVDTVDVSSRVEGDVTIARRHDSDAGGERISRPSTFAPTRVKRSINPGGDGGGDRRRSTKDKDKDVLVHWSRDVEVRADLVDFYSVSERDNSKRSIYQDRDGGNTRRSIGTGGDGSGGDLRSVSPGDGPRGNLAKELEPGDLVLYNNALAENASRRAETASAIQMDRVVCCVSSRSIISIFDKTTAPPAYQVLTHLYTICRSGAMPIGIQTIRETTRERGTSEKASSEIIARAQYSSGNGDIASRTTVKALRSSRLQLYPDSSPVLLDVNPDAHPAPAAIFRLNTSKYKLVPRPGSTRAKAAREILDMRRPARHFTLALVAVWVSAPSAAHSYVSGGNAFRRYPPNVGAVERRYNPEHDCKGTLCTDVVTTIEYGDSDDTLRGGPLAGGDIVTPVKYRERDELDSIGKATRDLNHEKGEEATMVEYRVRNDPSGPLQPHDGRSIKHEIDSREYLVGDPADGGEDDAVEASAVLVGIDPRTEPDLTIAKRSDPFSGSGADSLVPDIVAVKAFGDGDGEDMERANQVPAKRDVTEGQGFVHWSRDDDVDVDPINVYSVAEGTKNKRRIGPGEDGDSYGRRSIARGGDGPGSNAAALNQFKTRVGAGRLRPRRSKSTSFAVTEREPGQETVRATPGAENFWIEGFEWNRENISNHKNTSAHVPFPQAFS
ncbi:hypothetical protein BKA62DRAFT_758979 [Auriculariales sp. MPI-PUGE-AT-0066]|nr:hypothetical protein BKA62DRAFT_758979 [Auriculariales sp. MPI-PUGE-AT-0066]